MKHRSFKNLIAPVLLEVVLIFSGFIVPKLIMVHYGSAVNGLVQSITQFLGVISFFEAGVGSVIKYNLYGPLANKDHDGLSRIVVSAERFFRKLALGLLLYAALLAVIYPRLVDTGFSGLYTALLIAAMCVSSFAQYFWGQTNQLLLTADRRNHIQCAVQIITVVINTAVCVILIRAGAGIHLVKLAGAVIYLLRPLLLHFYVSRHYRISRKIEITGEPIRQKWNGLAQHIAYVVLEGTDVVVLSLFSTLSNVSVYSAYSLVVSNIKRLFISVSGSTEADVGESIARDDPAELKRKFRIIEWGMHTAATFVFGCTFVLILPFIRVYTNGVTDADYNVPVFAMLITAANYVHTLRLPYSNVILSGGHYKQTQKCYITAALINVIVSVVLVIRYGLEGVAIGTLVSMAYQNIWMALYVYRKVLGNGAEALIRQLLADVITVLLICFIPGMIKLGSVSYLSWFVMAVKVAVPAVCITAVINLLFYRKNIVYIFSMVRRKH